MRRRFRTILACLLIAIMVTGVAGCANVSSSSNEASENETAKSSNDTTNNPESNDVITLTVPTNWIGENPFAPYWKDVLTKFDAQYGDKIKIKTEEVPGSGGELDEKYKILIASNDLPDIVMTNALNIIQLASQANQLVDLKPYLEQDSDWLGDLDSKDLDYWGGESGKWFAVSSIKQKIAYFYNKDLFKKAGIEAPATTWDEFFDQCEKLKMAGITPLAMETKGAWIPSLWFVSMIGTSGETGNEFANTSNPTTYETPEVIEAAKNLQYMLMNYVASDSIGMDYNEAANGFYREETAMMANGLWQVPDFSDTTKVSADFKSKIGLALYPNDGIFSNVGPAWAIGSKDEAHIQAAITFLKFINDANGQAEQAEWMSSVPISPKVDVSKLKVDPLLAEMITLSRQAKFNYYQPWQIYQPSVVSIITNQIDALGYGQVTPEQFAKNLTVEINKGKTP